MTRLNPSKTAEGIAINRAAESRRPEHSRVFHDPYAVHFFSEQTLRVLRRPLLAWCLRTYRRWQYRGMYGAIVCRVRFIDDVLCSSIEDGADQVVLLGAGYDMRAYRFAHLMDGVKVFEVDDPDTQMVKTQKMKTIPGTPPVNISYVPMRFGRDDLRANLNSRGYDPEGKTLFIWEGVTMYLNLEEIDATLEFVVRHSGPGSSIVFDAFPPSIADGTNTRREVKALKKYTGSVGEPIRSGLHFGEIESFMKDRGFGHVRNVHVEQCRSDYLRPLNRKERVTPIFTFVHATVGNSHDS